VVGDTEPVAQRRYVELLAAQSPPARLRRAVSLSRTVRQLALTGLRSRHPDADPVELQARLADLLYGRAVAERLFGRRPR
jgi:hypothetical protein